LLDSLYYNVEDFCDLLHYIEDGYEELECCKNNPEKFYEIFYKEYIESLKTNNEDWEQELAKELKADMEDWEQEIAEIKSAFLKENKEANWAEEVERVKQWYEELQRLRDWKNN
jgi:hypothetical protein